MALRKGFGAQLAGANADDIRYDMAGTVVRSAAGVPRAGLFPPVASSLLTPTATMAVGIAAFSGVAVRDNGVVFLANVGSDTVTLTAPPSSNSRLDVIYAKQNDASAYVSTPDGNNTPVFGVLTGVASAIPVRNPAGLPQGAIELGTALVPSTATNTGSAGVVLTPTFQYTAMAGGRVAFNTKAQLDATPGSATLLHADVINDPSAVLNGGYSWNGVAWAMTLGDTGWIPLTLTGGWVPFGGTAYASPCYRRVNGRAKYSGLMKNGSISAGTTFANAPAGFRPGPNFQPMFACGGAAYAMVEVTTAGALKITAATSSTYIALDSIDYIAES